MNLKYLQITSTIIGILGLSLLSVAPAKAMGMPIDAPSRLFLTDAQSELVFIFSCGVVVGHIATRREEEKHRK